MIPTLPSSTRPVRTRRPSGSSATRAPLHLLTVLALAAGTGVVGSRLVSGQSVAQETVFVPIAPCRLIDTRPGEGNTGPRDGKIGADETVQFTAWGSGDGDSPCNVPNTATAISTNAVAVGPTAASFLTLYPGGIANPGTSNLNYTAGQPPTPNAANIPLATDGTFNVFNKSGDVHVVIDVNGYYQPSTTIGAPGPPGPAGPADESDTGHSVNVIDSVVGGGGDTSTAIGTNGNAIVSYFDTTDDEVKVASCATPTCTRATTTTIDATSPVGLGTSIAIGSDGNPVISYVGSTGDLKVAACTDPLCAAFAITPLDTTGQAFSPSIAIGSDGNPVISYTDIFDNDVKVAVCSNPFCAFGATVRVLDTTDDDKLGTSIAIGTDGSPIITYHDFTNSDLKVAACANPKCSAAIVTALETAGNTGVDPSISLGSDGNPVISFQDMSNNVLKVAACTNPSCTAATVNALGDGGRTSSISRGVHGNPVISYTGSGEHHLMVAACTDPTCTAATITALDTGGGFVSATSIVRNGAGHPVIGYFDHANRDVKVAVCGNPTCASYSGWSR